MIVLAQPAGISPRESRQLSLCTFVYFLNSRSWCFSGPFQVASPGRGYLRQSGLRCAPSWFLQPHLPASQHSALLDLSAVATDPPRSEHKSLTSKAQIESWRLEAVKSFVSNVTPSRLRTQFLLGSSCRYSHPQICFCGAVTLSGKATLSWQDDCLTCSDSLS